MKIQTRDGEFELTAEMVCKGMVFLYDPTGQRITTVRPYAERPGVVVCHPNAWECNPGGILFVIHQDGFRFLGCDPTIATRSDCEVYGVTPGIDAGGHGFARLRGGGVVDLRREELPNGSAVGFIGGAGRHYSVLRPLTSAERFIGLDARQARPEDIERLCCGEKWHEAQGIRHCTLAIGHDGDHEDIATGVRWGAEPDPEAVAAWQKRADAPGTAENVQRGVIRSLTGPLSFGRASRPHLEKDPRCHGEAVRTRPDGSGVAEGRSEDLRLLTGEALDLLAEERELRREPGETCEALRGRLTAHIRGERRAVRPRPAGPYRANARESGACTGCGGTVACACDPGPVRSIAGRDGGSAVRNALEPLVQAARQAQAKLDRRGAVAGRDGGMYAPPVCDSCGVGLGEQHRDDCARVKAHWATRCGVRPVRGQKLSASHHGYDEFIVATGEERCVNDKRCTGETHCHDADFRAFRWTNAPEYVDCAVCRARVMPYGELGPMAFGVWDEVSNRTRGGVVCETCSATARPEDLEWHGDRLVPKATAEAAARGAVALLAWCCRLWDERPMSTPEMLVDFRQNVREFNAQWNRLKSATERRRDEIVAEAFLCTPQGCDEQRWANVVRVLAADAAETDDPITPLWEALWQSDARRAIAVYARLRFVHGYDVREAVRRVLRAMGCDHCPQTERLFAAYEAGR